MSITSEEKEMLISYLQTIFQQKKFTYVEYIKFSEAVKLTNREDCPEVYDAVVKKLKEYENDN